MSRSSRSSVTAASWRPGDLQLGLFFMPLHDPNKPWQQSLEEDRSLILAAERLGFSEAWVGEHFTTRAEPIPSPLIFLATLIGETSTIKLGTGVVNLGHRHPVVVAAEAALFDQLSGGRLLLGVGPGGLASDAELFGRPDMAERMKVAVESIDAIQQLWSNDAPVRLDGQYWPAALENEIWPSHGVGGLCKPLQQPHPPLAMAMASPAGATVNLVAERDFIPISANFVPVSFVAQQWQTYAGVRAELGRDADPGIWRVCRNILITDSEAEAEELMADPDGVFRFYFRYLAGVRELPALNAAEAAGEAPTSVELNERFNVDAAIEKCVIAGTVDSVTEQLCAVVDKTGPFGTLVAVGHDDDGTGRWERSLERLAHDVRPRLAQHMAAT